MDKNFLKQIFEKYDIALSEVQVAQFENYFNLLIETNKVLNLTAITEEKDVIIKHFLDSVLPIKNFPQGTKVVDVGSGAGFPAIPLKIVRPDLEIVMVDSLNKRVKFLQKVISCLNLEKIYAKHDRIEDFARNNRESFDISTARAVASLNTLVEYLLPLTKIAGKAVIYKSSKLEEEMQISKKAIDVLGAKIDKIEHFFIKECDIERNVLILSKIKQTPNKFPRDKNKPKTNPIV